MLLGLISSPGTTSIKMTKMTKMNTKFPLTISSIIVGADVLGTDSKPTHVIAKNTISKELVRTTGIDFSLSVFSSLF